MPKNVLAMKWLPQRDILGNYTLVVFYAKHIHMNLLNLITLNPEHKNVIAFISHCGQGGTFEAIYTATPVIACPLYTDQPSNAALLEHLNVAVHLDIRSINKENVLNAVNTLINNTKYDRFPNDKKFSNNIFSPKNSPQVSRKYAKTVQRIQRSTNDSATKCCILDRIYYQA